MRRLVGSLMGLGVLAAGVYLAYTYGLSEEARDSLKKTASTLKQAYEKVSAVIEAQQGQVMADDGPLPNVQSTQRQWEGLGF